MSMVQSRRGEADRRLTPAMVSLRLHVLDFVHAYITRWRFSPSVGEIAEGVSASRASVKRAIGSLAASGLLIKSPGARGLALPADRDAAIQLLDRLGYLVAAGQGDGPNHYLFAGPVIDYTPSPAGGECGGGQR